MDILIMIDSGANVRFDNYTNVINALENLLKEMDIGPGKVQVGLESQGVSYE